MGRLIFLTVTFSLIRLTLHAQVDCISDVTITQGASITFCEESPTSLDASGGYTSYSWTGPQTSNSQSFIPTVSGAYQVAAVDNSGCTSTASINVTVNPTPTDVITSSQGNPYCPTSNQTTLSLSGNYSSYLWSIGTSTPTINVSESNTYSVEFTDANSCVGKASLNLTKREDNLVNSSGNACNGGSSVLTASGGVNYVWSTGEIGPSIEVEPEITTTYAVTISSQGNTCHQILTIEVKPLNEDSKMFGLPDTIFTKYEQSTEISGPNGFDSYLWQPTYQINDSSAQTTNFKGSESQWIYLKATHKSGCKYYDSTYMYVISKYLPNGFSPNGDGINDLFVIPDLDSLVGDLIVWNRTGEIVFKKDNYQNNWDGSCKGSFCMGDGRLPEGTYFYMVTIEGLIFKNYLTIKL